MVLPMATFITNVESAVENGNLELVPEVADAELLLLALFEVACAVESEAFVVVVAVVLESPQAARQAAKTRPVTAKWFLFIKAVLVAD